MKNKRNLNSLVLESLSHYLIDPQYKPHRDAATRIFRQGVIWGAASLLSNTLEKHHKNPKIKHIIKEPIHKKINKKNILKHSIIGAGAGILGAL